MTPPRPVVTNQERSRNPGDESRPGSAQTGEAICPACSGSGRRDGAACDQCAGTGRIVAIVGDA